MLTEFVPARTDLPVSEMVEVMFRLDTLEATMVEVTKALVALDQPTPTPTPAQAGQGEREMLVFDAGIVKEWLACSLVMAERGPVAWHQDIRDAIARLAESALRTQRFEPVEDESAPDYGETDGQWIAQHLRDCGLTICKEVK
jgi:hypothetical protein